MTGLREVVPGTYWMIWGQQVSSGQGTSRWSRPQVQRLRGGDKGPPLTPLLLTGLEPLGLVDDYLVSYTAWAPAPDATWPEF